MKKKNDKIEYLDNLYLYVCAMATIGTPISEISYGIGLSKQNLNYKIKPLIINNILKKIGFGTWEVDWNNFDNFHKKLVKKNKQPYGIGNNGKNKRGHGYKFTVKIPKIRNWARRKDYLDKKNIIYKTIPQGQRIIIDDHKIWLCNGSLVIHFPETLTYLEYMAIDCYLKALDRTKLIIGKIESLLHINFKIKDQWKIKVSSQHHAIIENNLAKKYINSKDSFFIRDKYGNIWALIDNSKKSFEFELINNKTSVNDCDLVTDPLFNDIGKDNLTNYFNDVGKQGTKDILNDRRDNPTLMLPSQMQETLAMMIKKQQLTDNSLELATYQIKEMAIILNKILNSINL